MCGIAGLLNLRGEPIDRSLLHAMTGAILHRGPEALAVWVRGQGSTTRDPGLFRPDGGGCIPDAPCPTTSFVGLGHTRLRIIDVAGGDQPIWNEDESCLIVFNGEIYNFRELRAELESRGHRFRTATDTEAILHAYEEWGNDCPQRLRGMFAFAIWNERDRELFLARDRLGIKPLHLAWRGDTLAFASEIKALLRDPELDRGVDAASFDAYLSLGYVPGPGTIFRSVTALPAGHSLRLRVGRPSAEPQRYWRLPLGAVRPRSEAECLEELDFRLRDVVGRHLVTDVPLGVFLSGGIDSSTLAAVAAGLTAAPLRTFSIGFPAQRGYDEAPFARRVAQRFGSEHQEVMLEPEAVEWLSELVWHLDQPLADPSVIPLYSLARMTRQHVTVALAGDGGDELFGGYERYFWDSAAARYARLPVSLRRGLIEPVLSHLPHLPLDVRRDPFRRARKLVRHAALPAASRYFNWFELMTPDLKEALGVRYRLLGGEEDITDSNTQHPSPNHHFEVAFAEAAAGGGSALDAMQSCDLQTMLRDDLLHKCDRVTMAVALEARVPFLDHELVEWAFTLPEALRVSTRLAGTRCTLKHLLKRWLSRHLPGELIHRRKQGFEVPVYDWLIGPLRGWMRDLLLSPGALDDGFVRPEAVRRLVERLERGERVLALPVYSLVAWQLWRQQFLRSPGYRYNAEPLRLSAPLPSAGDEIEGEENEPLSKARGEAA
jgi:asparagine synthase (glutamine-hydrolysing)